MSIPSLHVSKSMKVTLLCSEFCNSTCLDPETLIFSRPRNHSQGLSGRNRGPTWLSSLMMVEIAVDERLITVLWKAFAQLFVNHFLDVWTL